MKKHNDGYVLPFVLVVLVVVCIVAVSLMTAALSNLNRQQASIQRMQAKYAAQGEIELDVIEWTNKVNQVYRGNFPEGMADEQKTKYAAELVLKEIFGTDIPVVWTGGKFEYECSKQLEESLIMANVTVSITILEADVTLNTLPEGEERPADFADYQVPVKGIVVYDSYTISHEEVTQDDT